MADFSCTSSTGVFFWFILCYWRIIWRTDGKGKPSKTVAEIQGWHCNVWSCAQLWKDMPHISGITELYAASFVNSIVTLYIWTDFWNLHKIIQRVSQLMISIMLHLDTPNCQKNTNSICRCPYSEGPNHRKSSKYHLSFCNHIFFQNPNALFNTLHACSWAWIDSN